jgi:RNA polymerase sigma factor (sigma-70 family)
MPIDHLTAFLRRLRRTTADDPGRPATDAELLERFVAARDPAAFELLLYRHGPLVHGVCRRLLADPHAADDAFQATFLIFVRKAGAIARRERVGPWLFGVAHRVALRARRKVGHEPPLGDREPAAQAAAPPELRDDVHEAVRQLPARYRDAVVLCYLEGRTHEEAARELGWPVGTVKGRLARARDLLRRRLGAFAPTAVAPALLPDGLARAAVAAALGAGGTTNAAVEELVNEVIPMLSGNRIKVGGLVIVALTACGLGAAVAAGVWPNGAPPAAPPGSPPPQAALPGLPFEATDAERLQGAWTLVAVQRNGKRLAPPGPGDDLFRHAWFDKNRVTVETSQQLLEGTYEYDEVRQPAHIDVTTGVGRPSTLRGIYNLEGDRLTLYISQPGGGRPGTLVAHLGSSGAVQVFQKTGPATGPNLPAQQLARLRATSRARELAEALHDSFRTGPGSTGGPGFPAGPGGPGGPGMGPGGPAGVGPGGRRGGGRGFGGGGPQPPPVLPDIRTDAGKPLLSWRVAILPYIGQADLYAQFKLDEPWDGPHNKKLLDQVPEIFAPIGAKANVPGGTFYQTVTGPGTWSTLPDAPARWQTVANPDALMVVEAGEAVPWTKPADVVYDPAKPLPKLGGMVGDGRFSFATLIPEARSLPVAALERHRRALFDGQRSGPRIDWAELDR